MISQDLIRLMQEERERQVQRELRVRRLLGPRRPFIRWRPTSGRFDGSSTRGAR
jgi:hypothetical protein